MNMNSAAALLVPVTLFTVMLALGVSLPVESLRQWRRYGPLILRAELGTCLLVPLLGWLLLCLPPARGLSGEARHAIALMAACPSAPLILRKAGKVGGDVFLAGLLQVIAALLAIVTVPLLAPLGERLFGVVGWDVRPLQVALQVAKVQLAPLLLGLVLRSSFPAMIQRLQGPLERLANGLLVLLVGAVLSRTAPLLWAFSLNNLAALPLMALLVLISLALGFALTGEPDQRISAALVISMRNPGLALLLASTYAPAMPAVKLWILLYVLVTVILWLPVLRWQRQVQALR